MINNLNISTFKVIKKLAKTFNAKVPLTPREWTQALNGHGLSLGSNDLNFASTFLHEIGHFLALHPTNKLSDNIQNFLPENLWEWNKNYLNIENIYSTTSDVLEIDASVIEFLSGKMLRLWSYDQEQKFKSRCFRTLKSLSINYNEFNVRYWEGSKFCIPNNEKAKILSNWILKEVQDRKDKEIFYKNERSINEKL